MIFLPHINHLPDIYHLFVAVSDHNFSLSEELCNLCLYFDHLVREKSFQGLRRRVNILNALSILLLYTQQFSFKRALHLLLSLVNQISQIKLHTFEFSVQLFNLQIKVLVGRFSLLLQNKELFFEQTIDFGKLFFISCVSIIQSLKNVIEFLIEVFKLLLVVFVTEVIDTVLTTSLIVFNCNSRS